MKKTAAKELKKGVFEEIPCLLNYFYF